MERLQGTGSKDEDEKVKDEDQEETVDEKIERLRMEIHYLFVQVREKLTNLPPITKPPVPAPLLELRRAIKEKDMERELLLEEQRASKVVEEYLQENPAILEKVDDCPICLEPIFDVDAAVTFYCCGKPTCGSCAEPLSAAGNDICPLCREEFPSDGESLSILRRKAAAGKAWAQCNLGRTFLHGSSGLEVDEQKAESLFRNAADQGYSQAQFLLGIIELDRNNTDHFEAAASQGHMSALGRLGIYYFIGLGVAKDDMKAVRLLTVSSKLQTADRCVHRILAECFAFGKGGLDVSMVRSVYYMKPSIEGADETKLASE